MPGWFSVAHAASTSEEVFQLGTLTVLGEKPAPAERLESGVSAATMRLLDKKNAGEALATAPGVTLARIGGRNETVVFVRGYDRLQVPIFIDGVPAYVPYDGFVDLGRFTTYDLGALQIAKGYGSVLYGPNTLGGSINLVSRRPTQSIEGEVRAGLFDGDGREAAANLGGRRERWYYQVGVSALEQETFRLADGFVSANANQPGRERENADSRDTKISAKLAYTPNDTDEYVFGFSHQEGEKGQPTYTGTASAGQINRFWRWPEWDKQTVYLVSHTRIGEESYIKPRIYYDRYANTLDQYTDRTYTTLRTGGSGPSFYDDYSYGASLEAGTTALPRQTTKVALHTKFDHHTEQILSLPAFTFEDRTVSLGLENTVHLAPRWDVQGSLGYDWRDTVRADQDNPDGTPVTLTRFDSLNPQIGLFHQLTDTDQLHLTVARKSRFPSIKDRYSYRLATAIPNPDLDPEIATHYELGYVGRPRAELGLRAAVFYSRTQDAIQSVDDVAVVLGVPRSQNQNVGEVETRGFEIGADYAPAAFATFGGAYTYIDRENLTNPLVQPTDVPRHNLQLHAELRPTGCISLVPSLNYASERVFNTNGATIPCYTVTNFKVVARLPHDVTLEAGVRNVFDKNYAISEGYPEPGRSWFVNASVSF